MQIPKLILIGGAFLAAATHGPRAQEILSGAVDTRIGKIELQSGYPSNDSVRKIYDEIDFQRAAQAYVWATPAVAFEAMLRGNKRDWGVDFNDVGLVDNYTTPAIKALTGNDTTIYAIVFANLGRDGPVVIDSPKGVYGVIDDWWQRPIVEVGPFGPDKGEGGKFLLLPPNSADNLPGGYLPANRKLIGPCSSAGPSSGTATSNRLSIRWPGSRFIRSPKHPRRRSRGSFTAATGR